MNKHRHISEIGVASIVNNTDIECVHAVIDQQIFFLTRRPPRHPIVHFTSQQTVFCTRTAVPCEFAIAIIERPIPEKIGGTAGNGGSACHTGLDGHSTTCHVGLDLFGGQHPIEHLQFIQRTHQSFACFEVVCWRVAGRLET